MISPSNLIAYLDSKNKPVYSREHFDAFLKEVNFKFKNKAIHITGTNGKGSVAYFLSKVLSVANYKVGRFISPTLSSYFEMITINEEEISPADFSHILNEYYNEIEKHNLTQFEIITFVGLTYFKKKKVDIAIIEVGMGGALDATNIFTPILSIITTVSVEHTAYLGKTLQEIATHKAGIIKKKVPVLVGNMPLEAFNVIASKAMSLGANLFAAKEPTDIRVDFSGVSFNALSYQDVRIAIPAIYEAYNVTLVLNALDIIREQFPVKKDTILHAIINITIPARFSIAQKAPLVIIDGAHNPSAMMTLINSLMALTKRKIHVVFAAFKDKDIEHELDLLSLANADVVLTTYDHPRARKANDFPSSYPFCENYKEAIDNAIRKAPVNDIVLITGSLNFALLVYEEMAGKNHEK